MEFSRELLLAAGLALTSIIIGLLVGEVGWALFIGLSIWVFVQHREFRRVVSWTKRPLRRPDNGLDSWFELAYQPFRALRRERRRTKAMLTRLQEVMTLVEGIPDGVIILTPTAEIEGFNAAARDFLRLTQADLGLGLATVVRVPGFVAFLRSPTGDDPLEFISPFDAERNFEIRRFDVETGRTVVIVRDITTLNRLLTMRQNFVANVSHELRTPMTVVAGYLETMLDETQDRDLRLDLANKFSRPLKRMQSLVDDLLLLTRLESASVPKGMEVIGMRRVVEAARTELASMQDGADQIVINIVSNRPILGIETELHSVCTNLIANALRFSPGGEPVVVTWEDVGEKVRLSVRDNGVGIPADHIDRLTERFYRVDLAGARSRGGTGLGLAIVKHVLRRHESELHVQSKLGDGSLFYCDFDPVTEGVANHETSMTTTHT